MHLFSSHFFTKLIECGTAHVKSWTTRKDIDIFGKKLVFIPINDSGHWSLLVVVNAGLIKKKKADENTGSIPCILFFDSLKKHNARLFSRYIRNWLNYIWNHNHTMEEMETPFTRKTIPMYEPVGKVYFVTYHLSLQSVVNSQ